ncbi:MAG: signal peptidase I [Chloroflexi bacterium]|nr:signal peptidase I [Chloroflexota bacterium]
MVSEPVSAEEKTNWRRFAFDILETLALAAILFFGINAVSARVRVDGFSMIPTLQDGEFVLVSKLNYVFTDAERGDIVVFYFPMDPGQELIKRVIGVPGDHVVVKDGTVTVNGQALSEPYIAEAPRYNGEWGVPDGQLFVLGDNRNDSSDSHSWGLLPAGNVVGKAVVIYWPPQMWKIIRHGELIAEQ